MRSGQSEQPQYTLGQPTVKLVTAGRVLQNDATKSLCLCVHVRRLYYDMFCGHAGGQRDGNLEPGPQHTSGWKLCGYWCRRSKGCETSDRSERYLVRRNCFRQAPAPDGAIPQAGAIKDYGARAKCRFIRATSGARAHRRNCSHDRYVISDRPPSFSARYVTSLETHHVERLIDRVM